MTNKAAYYTEVRRPHNTHGQAYIPVTSQTSAASGPEPDTAEPHRSDLLNRLDPRVDATAAAHGHDGYTAYGNYEAGSGDVRHSHHGGRPPAMPPSAMAMQGRPTPGYTGQQKDAPDGTFDPHHSHHANALDARADNRNPDYRKDVRHGSDSAGHAHTGLGKELSSRAVGTFPGPVMPTPAAAPTPERGEARVANAGAGRHHTGGHNTYPRHPEVSTIARDPAYELRAHRELGMSATGHSHSGGRGPLGLRGHPNDHGYNAGAPASFGAAGYDEPHHGHSGHRATPAPSTPAMGSATATSLR